MSLPSPHPAPRGFPRGRRAAARVATLTGGLSADDLVWCLVSGGGWALPVMPAASLSFKEKRVLNKALLKCGAAIDELNCVRKHLSAIKGGRLGAMYAPARVVTLLIGDVPGDAPKDIASGPTVPDASTCADAPAICRRCRIALPALARAMAMGLRGAGPLDRSDAYNAFRPLDDLASREPTFTNVNDFRALFIA